MFGEGLCPPEPSKSNNTEVVVRVTTEVVRPGQASYRVRVLLKLEMLVMTGESSNIFRGPLLTIQRTLVPRNRQTHKLGNILMLNLWNNRIINPNGSI